MALEGFSTTGMTTASLFGFAAGAIDASTRAAAVRTEGRLIRKALQRRLDLMKHRRKEVRAAGDLAEAQARQATRQLIGAQRVAAAAQGISLGSGSLLQLQQEATDLGQLDALTIRNNARRQMAGIDLQIGETRLEKSLARLGQRTTSRGTLVTGVSQAASRTGSDLFTILEG